MFSEPRPSVEEFRATLGLFATGITVVTARVGDLAHGMTANAVASVSLDPLLVLVCVERTAIMHKVIQEAGAFAISILAADQEHLSRWFADPLRPAGRAQFDGVAVLPGPATGAPLVEGALGWVECDLHASHDGGDHAIHVGRVRSLARAAGGNDPLLYFRSGYRSLAARDTSAGAEPDLLDPVEQGER